MTLKNFKAITLTSALLLAVGCGEDEQLTYTPSPDAPGQARQSVSIPDTEFSKGVKIYDNVRAIEANEMAKIQKSAPDTLTIEDQELAGTYDAGDVLVSDVGDGLFRVVESIEQGAGGEVVLKTRPAELIDAVAEGQIYVAKLTAASNLTPPQEFLDAPTSELSINAQKLSPAQAGKSFGWEGSFFEYSKDFSSQLTAAIDNPHLKVTAATINAEIGAEAYANVKYRFKNPLESAKLAANGTANATLRVQVISPETFEYDKTFKLVGDPSTNPFLAVSTKEHTLLPGIFPLKFTFETNADLQVKASVKGELRAEVGYTVAAFVEGGVERKNGSWQWVSKRQFDGKLYGPEFTGQKNFSASAELTTSLKLSVGEKADGSIDFQPVHALARVSQDINADTKQCPTKAYLNVNGRVDGEFNWIKIPILRKKKHLNLSKSQELYNVTPVDYTKQLNLPLVCDAAYMPPTQAGTVGSGEACGSDDECISNVCHVGSTCVTEGKLRVSMSWEGGKSDFDLYVKDPSGNVTSYIVRRTEISRYDFSTCTNPGECPAGRAAVESVYFPSDAPDGTYEVWAQNERAEGVTSAKLEVDLEGQIKEGTLNVPDKRKEESGRFTFSVSGGQLQ